MVSFQYKNVWRVGKIKKFIHKGHRQPAYPPFCGNDYYLRNDFPRAF